MEIINKYPIFINDRKLDAQEIYHLTPYFSEFNYSLKNNLKSPCFFYEFGRGLSFKNEKGFLGPFDFYKQLHRFPKTLGSKKKELLAKSIGLEHLKNNENVIDMTCGLGTDSLKISYWGGNVTSFERNPICYILVSDALVRLGKIKGDEQFFQLKFGELLGNRNNYDSFTRTVLYYDPMYPDANKKSLPSGKIQALRFMVGEDLDIEEQLNNILALHPKRFVMKRPKKGKVLCEERLHHQIIGSSTRFDIYT